MFYSTEILTVKKGGFGVVWYVAWQCGDW